MRLVVCVCLSACVTVNDSVLTHFNRLLLVVRFMNSIGVFFCRAAFCHRPDIFSQNVRVVPMFMP